ncbi:MAG: putative peptidoglycan glycosyltransferase FtsW [Pseudomonadota bacterium]|nr:putative peptidoglycan glycosyltransferase FtsW [Pseudomonadota bacterium]
MTNAFTRNDTSVLGIWWWTIDKYMLVIIGLLFLVGSVLILAAGPPAAYRIGADSFYFVRKQFLFIPLCFFIIFTFAFVKPIWLKRISVIFLGSIIFLTILTTLFGLENNGAKRWIRILSFSLQPSEFIKPFIIIFSAWMLSIQNEDKNFPGVIISLIVLSLVCLTLALQPDIGMSLLMISVWCSQLFIFGIPIIFFAMGALILLILSGVIYLTFPHVASRVDRFIDPLSGDNYQINQAILAFNNGGIFGRGPGEGRVKETLPDAHTDFIFAVAGEEFGFWLCIFIIFLFCFLSIRVFLRIFNETNVFVIIAITGLTVQLSMQALINMASSLHMIPTKGMTLPLISYGGSSMISTAICIGIILSLTRRNINTEI